MGPLFAFILAEPLISFAIGAFVTGGATLGYKMFASDKEAIAIEEQKHIKVLRKNSR
jgi:hypothetical protein